MNKIWLIAVAFCLFAGSARAQQTTAIGPLPPCAAFGTAAGSCAQGNDSRFSAPTITGGTINNATVGITTPAAIKGTTIWQSSRNAYTNFTTSQAYTNSTTSGLMAGFGSAWTLTPSFSGRVRVTVNGVLNTSVITTTAQVWINYGTGTAPSTGAASTGTHGWTTVSSFAPITAGAFSPVSYTFEVTGLTLATAVWFDVQIAAANAGSATFTATTVTIEEF